MHSNDRDSVNAAVIIRFQQSNKFGSNARQWIELVYNYVSVCGSPSSKHHWSFWFRCMLYIVVLRSIYMIWCLTYNTKNLDCISYVYRNYSLHRKCLACHFLISQPQLEWDNATIWNQLKTKIMAISWTFIQINLTWGIEVKWEKKLSTAFPYHDKTIFFLLKIRYVGLMLIISNKLSTKKARN